MLAGSGQRAPAHVTCGVGACDLPAGETQKGTLPAPLGAPHRSQGLRPGLSLPSTHSSGPYRGGIHGVLLFPLIPAVFNLLHHLGLGLGHQLPQSLVTGDTADEGVLRGQDTG